MEHKQHNTPYLLQERGSIEPTIPVEIKFDTHEL